MTNLLYNFLEKLYIKEIDNFLTFVAIIVKKIKINVSFAFAKRTSFSIILQNIHFFTFISMTSFKTKNINEKKKLLSPRSWIIKIFVSIILGIFGIWFVLAVWIRILGWIDWVNELASKVTDGSWIINNTIQAVKTLTKSEWTKTNILLVGIWGKWHDWWELTDSILLASLNTEKKTVSLLSIPRDLWVSYPGGTEGRINELYSFGKKQWVGMQYLKDKVTEITGEKIAYYGIIDFTGFKKVVDILGGIEVEVPEDLIDREYPTINWQYSTFAVRKWLQTFNWDTALKYARSRHSTSDFSRSQRQQLIIGAIKEKFLQLGFISDADKIFWVIKEIESHFETDLWNTNILSLALSMKDIPSNRMLSFNLNNSCWTSHNNCQMGAYLYSPNRDFFWWASVLLVEWIQWGKKEEKYNNTQRLTSLGFNYPWYLLDKNEITIINGTKQEWIGNLAGIALKKLGFTLSRKKPLISYTGWILEKTRIHVYWDEETSIGINPISDTYKALELLVGKDFITHSWWNLYVTDDGPKIEIILGKDYKDMLPFIRFSTYAFTGPSPEEKKEEKESFLWSGSINKVPTKLWSGTIEKIKKTSPDILNKTNVSVPKKWTATETNTSQIDQETETISNALFQ